MSWAKQQERRRWLWGGLTGLLMYNLVFWDWIPTMIAYKYYCNTQAGFTVFKTPEQWLSENSSLSAEHLKSSRKKNGIGWSYERKMLPRNPDKKVSIINEFIYEDMVFTQHICCFLPINKRTYYVADVRNSERLFEYVTFWTGYSDLFGNKNIGHLKIWLNNGGCMGSDNNEDTIRKRYYDFINQIAQLGEQNHDK